jgi:UDP-N-acetylmuramoyl-tripeptide--D-alanyl-D-alanine ligase
MMTLDQAEHLLPGSIRLGAGTTPITRVHTDTRSLQPGDLFVALRGERFDAHDFLPQAAAAGAAAALVTHGITLAADGRAHPLPGLQVNDTQTALSQLARAWRQHHHLPVIAVTGSNGKTTVTQMIGAILAAWMGDAALVTRGNLNNHIGVPLTVLRLRQDDASRHRSAVIELGMNHPGEIAELADIARPSVALVNNAQREHLEFMNSVEAVARENGSVIEALPGSGIAVFPAGDAFAPLWQHLAGLRRVLRFTAVAGDAPPPAGVDVVGRAEWVAGGEAAAHWSLCIDTPRGRVTTRVHLPGRHNIHNALAAAAAALAAGCPLGAIGTGLDRFRAVAGRSSLVAVRLHGQALTLVDDSYNANPDSMHAAIELLAALPGPRWLVIGDMGEVGGEGPAFHREVGAAARELGIEHLWCAGQAMQHAATAFGPAARWFEDARALAEALGPEADAAPRCAAALVKGSRFMRMEQVVAALRGDGALAAGGAH